MYRELNDYEILYMVSEERDNTFSILYTKYRPLIYKIVKEYMHFFKKFGYELDDLMQIGYLTLYKSSSLYDIYNDSMFYSYFKSALTKSIITEIRYNKTLKREILNNALSYDSVIPNSKLTYLDILPDTKKKYIHDENNLIIFKNSMPFDMANIFELFYNGYCKNEISILLDSDIDDINKLFKRIKEHALTYKYLFFK